LGLNWLEQITKDLTEYRSHLARHKLEQDFDDAEFLQDLDDSTALVISDFKMKILSCFFRENQLKFFGKRGTSCLGFFMITTNPTDPDARENGIKDVKFVMMFTDDANQDEQSVAAAKHEIYSNHLPEGITKVFFHSDGAGCFKSAYHKVVQLYWLYWAGIQEKVNRVTPAGGGKSALDGMFGRMNSCLASAVDTGLSYYDAETTCQAIEASNGLSASTILQYKPNRTGRLFATFETTSLESVLRSELDQSNGSITVYKHSGFGKGRRIYPSEAVFSLKCKPSKAIINNDTDLLFPRKQCMSPFSVAKYVVDFLEQHTEEQFQVLHSNLEQKHFALVILPMILHHNSSCEEVLEYSNKKKDINNVRALAGQGANHPDMRQARQQSCIASR
jgi:hypothetical protein